MLLIALTACKKNYTCTCTSTSSGSNSTSTSTSSYKKISKSQANIACPPTSQSTYVSGTVTSISNNVCTLQ